MIGSWHNHTKWSDGSGSVAQMVHSAERLGVQVLGISDHLVLDPAGIRHVWSMDPGAVGAYVTDVREGSAGAAAQVLCGIEADFIPETAAQTAAIIAGHGIEFVVASVHFVDGFPVDSSAEPWEALTVEERDCVHVRYWELVREMAAAGFGDIAAHLDLPKKFGFRPQRDLTAVINHALDAIAGAGMVVEVNTAGWHKPCNEAYPSLAILQACRERNIPVTINADAHEPSHLLRDFGRAAALLREAGYRAQTMLTSDGRREIPIPEYR